MRRAASIAALCALALAVPQAAGAQTGAAQPRVLLAFLPTLQLPPGQLKNPNQKGDTPTQQLLKELDRRKPLSLGLLGATQGSYTPQQAVLDMTQGTRVSNGTYHPKDPPDLQLQVIGSRGYIANWPLARQRAKTAPQTTVPGLLASGIPGGAAYAGVLGLPKLDAVVAADRGGNIAAVSLGSRYTVVDRALKLLARHRFVVADLPPNAPGARALDDLIARRLPGEQLLVVQQPPDVRNPQLLPLGVLRPGSRIGGVSSLSTSQQGIVAGIDVAPTVLHWLHLKVSGDVRGEPINITGDRDAKGLDDFRHRLAVLPNRRLPTLQGLLLTWVMLLFALGAINGWQRARRQALRIGALAVMWVPVMVLVSALVGPKKAVVELALIVAGALALGATTDRLVPWPRAPVVPAVFGLGWFALDLANHSHVIVRSLLGPNPKFGSRFYGIGNELEPALTVLLFIGFAALFHDRPKSKRLAGMFALSGLVLAAILGSGRLGSDVGAVITVGAGTAVGTLLLLPGRPSRRAIALAVITPVAAVAALALLDIVTGGHGHFTRNVLQAHGKQNLADTVIRRSKLAVGSTLRGRMPVVTLAAALAALFAWRNRVLLYGPVAGRPVWTAALLGGLAAGIAGSAGNDSGSLLFVISIFVLGVLTAYIQGDPRLAEAPASGREAGLAREDGQRARPPTTAPVPAR